MWTETWPNDVRDQPCRKTFSAGERAGAKAGRQDSAEEAAGRPRPGQRLWKGWLEGGTRGAMGCCRGQAVGAGPSGPPGGFAVPCLLGKAASRLRKGGFGWMVCELPECSDAPASGHERRQLLKTTYKSVMRLGERLRWTMTKVLEGLQVNSAQACAAAPGPAAGKATRSGCLLQPHVLSAEQEEDRQEEGLRTQAGEGGPGLGVRVVQRRVLWAVSSSRDSKPVPVWDPDVRKGSKRALSDPKGGKGSSETMGNILWVLSPILAQPCLQTSPPLSCHP